MKRKLTLSTTEVVPILLVTRVGWKLLLMYQAEVISNFQKMIDNSGVKNILNTNLGKMVRNVTYDGNDFHYVDASGDAQTIEIKEIVKANETTNAVLSNRRLYICY